MSFHIDLSGRITSPAQLILTAGRQASWVKDFYAVGDGHQQAVEGAQRVHGQRLLRSWNVEVALGGETFPRDSLQMALGFYSFGWHLRQEAAL
mmetsp:Transcript_77575/g.171369  ORF Transcript_77575/g.171369 Transcript_77575/m.171369 type:complete len:93 (-) Transcript_77575:498-776(-)